MSVIMDYLSRTTGGMEQFFAADKMVVLLLAVFFLFWLQDKKMTSSEGDRLLIFALVAGILLLCPFTAMVGVIYQTAFYDYEWLWSMVPVTIILSYAAVLVYDTKVDNTNWKKKVASVVAFLFLLFWCGNQGMLKTVDTDEAEQQKKVSQMLEVLVQEATEGEIVLWAPKSIMQETRRRTGAIKLVYGRDMWEAKAGAYDYEAYSDVLIEAYEWIEDAETISTDTIPKVVKILWQEEDMAVRFKTLLPDILSMKVNCIIIPMEVEELFETVFFPEISEMGIVVEEVLIEDYILYRLK